MVVCAKVKMFDFLKLKIYKKKTYFLHEKNSYYNNKIYETFVLFFKIKKKKNLKKIKKNITDLAQ